MTVHGLGLTEHIQGTEGVMALVNLALLTGNIGKPGAGVNPLRGQNNVQGAAHMGCEPRLLTGYDAARRRARARSRRLAAPVPTHRGLNLHGDDGRRRRGQAQGALGDRLRRLADEPERRADARARWRSSTSSSCRTSS